MSVDIHAVVARLTDFQQAICAKISHTSVLAAARELGVSRDAVLKEIGNIRKRFEQAGLRDFL